MLPLNALIPLLVAFGISCVVQYLALFIRAHKVEKFTMIGFSSGILMAALTVIVSKSYGAQGLAVCLLLVNAVYILPWALVVFKRVWIGSGTSI
jgi:NADH:ubiquinone oxidoreductase subunit 3 (subunit A)